MREVGVLRRIFWFALLLFSLSNDLEATHIVGGEINYRCLGDDKYEIRLQIYRDCVNGVPYFDDPASIGFFDVNNELILDIPELDRFGNLNVMPMGDDTLQPQLLDSCFVIPPDVCVHTTVYIDTVTLTYREGGYTMVYQRCCRNRTIQNIQRPDSTGATYLTYISEQALRDCNSNPVFKEWPPPYICVNRNIDFDHSAIDFDGDSLVYRLCTPLTGATNVRPQPAPPNHPPYDSVAWLGPNYSRLDMLGGIPLRINSKTGRLTGVPNTLGQFVVGICVEEYRDGRLISFTRRDFQYNVGQCSRITATYFADSTFCERTNIYIENESFEYDSSIWRIKGPNEIDSLIIQDDLQLDALPQGNYFFTLIVFNQFGCPDSLTRPIRVLPNPVQASVKVNIDSCGKDSVRLAIIDRSINSDTTAASILYTLHQNDRLIDSIRPFYVNDTGRYYIVQDIIASNGCFDRDTFSFISPILPIVIQDSLFICAGDSAKLTLDRSLYDGIHIEPADYRTITDSGVIFFYPDQDTSFIIQLDKDSFCPFRKEVQVKLVQPPAPSFIPDTFCENTPITIPVEGGNESEFIWEVDHPWYQGNLFMGQTLQIDSLPIGSTRICVKEIDTNNCSFRFCDTIIVNRNFLIPGFELDIGNCDDSIRINKISRAISLDSSSLRDSYLVYSANRLIADSLPFYLKDTGHITVIQRIENQYGCEAFDTVHFKSPLQEYSLPDSSFICPGDSAVVTFDPSEFDTLIWQTDSFIYQPNQGETFLFPNTTRTFQLTIRKDSFCDYQQSITVVRIPKPKAIFLADTFCESTPIYIRNQSDSSYRFFWDVFSFIYAGQIFTERDLILDSLPVGPTRVCLFAIDPFGCRDTMCDTIIVVPNGLQAGFSLDEGNCADSVRVDVINHSFSTDSLPFTTKYELFQQNNLVDSVFPFYFTDSQDLQVIQMIENEFGCVDSDTATLASPIQEIDLPDTILICMEDSAQLVLSSDLFDSISWMPQPSAALLNDTTLVFFPREAQEIELRLYKEGFCDVNKQLYISFYASPLAFFEADTFCEKGIIMVENESDSTYTSQWTISHPDFEGEVFNTRDLLLDSLPLGAIEVCLTVTDSNACTDRFCDSIVGVENGIIPGFEIGFGECGDSVDIHLESTAFSQDGRPLDIQYDIIFGDSIVHIDSIFYTTDTTSFIIVQHITNDLGCVAFDTAIFTSPLIHIPLPDTQCICQGDKVVLNPMGSNPNYIYQWMPEESLDNSLSVQPIASPSISTLFIVMVKGDSICPYIDSTFVWVKPNAEIVQFETEENPVLEGQSHTIFFETQFADTVYLIPDSLYDDVLVSPFMTQINEETELLLVAQNNMNCPDTARLVLSLRSTPCEEPYVFIPNAFSPNQDGLNDEFKVYGESIIELQGMIYDRWGQKVYEFTSPEDAWDGMIHGKEAGIDGYGYYFMFRCSSEEPFQERKGNVTLFR